MDLRKMERDKNRIENGELAAGQAESKREAL